MAPTDAGGYALSAKRTTQELSGLTQGLGPVTEAAGPRISGLSEELVPGWEADNMADPCQCERGIRAAEAPRPFQVRQRHYYLEGCGVRQPGGAVGLGRWGGGRNPAKPSEDLAKP
jgi:hypothetical protein